MIAVTSNSASKAVSERSMDGTVATPVLPFQRRRHGSPFYRRLAEEWGLAKEKTARDTLKVPYLRVATANRLLREYDMGDKCDELMAVIVASLAADPVSLKDAMDRHNMADAIEDAAQAEFIKNAGDVELQAWISKLAGDIANAERLLRALIAERDARGAK